MDKENHLFPEDPYYLPRYCGYLPQFKYRIGKTYGNHSSDILTDPNVRRSPRYVLSSTEPVYPQNPTREVAILRSKRDSWGSELFTEHMLPGYAGYIPKNQHYFSRPYGDVCRSALSHHELEQTQMTAQRREDKRILSKKTGLPNMGHSTDGRIPYPPSRNPPKSSYFEKPENPMWFKSGYTGFVPRTRELIALGYPNATNVGLKTFNNNLNGNETRRDEMVSVDGPRTKPEPKAALYPQTAGMIPHYTGYIPGYKYRIGKTYGRHTYNTLRIYENSDAASRSQLISA